MADANKTLITRAEVTSIITPTTKRFALVMDGQTIELGKTGPRDVSGTLQNVSDAAAGGLVVSRDGNIVTVKVAASPLTASSQIINNPVLFASFAPSTTQWEQGRGGIVGITTGGTVYIQGGTPGTKTYATLVYATENPWPGGLPGVPLGDPVVI